MSWTSLAETKKSFGGGKGMNADELKMRIVTNKKGKKSLYVRIGSDVLEKAKLKEGDSIDLLVDGDKGLIRKDPGGWRLTKSGKHVSKITLNWANGPFEFEGSADLKYKIGKEGLVFNLPVTAE